jgi:hypothetical protein
MVLIKKFSAIYKSQNYFTVVDNREKSLNLLYNKK